MFERVRNMDRAFQAMRLIMLVVIIGCLIVTVYAIYSNQQLSARAQDRVYVLHNGKAAEVFAASRKENIEVESRDHVRRFHELFFSLDPDEKAIAANIKKALYLSDATAKKQYDDLVETGYIAGIISGNVSQQITIDSVLVVTAVEPFAFRCYATIRIIRSTSMVTRNLVTQGYLRSMTRTDNNPHGFLIEKWETMDNRDIKIEER